MNDPHELDCPQCGSEDVVIWLRKPIIHCISCGHDFPDPWKDIRGSEQKVSENG